MKNRSAERFLTRGERILLAINSAFLVICFLAVGIFQTLSSGAFRNCTTRSVNAAAPAIVARYVHVSEAARRLRRRVPQSLRCRYRQ